MQEDGRTLEREEAYDGLDVCRCCCPYYFEPMDPDTPVTNAAMTLNKKRATGFVTANQIPSLKAISSSQATPKRFTHDPNLRRPRVGLTVARNKKNAHACAALEA